MRGRAVLGLRRSGRRAVTVAVLRGAQVRSAYLSVCSTFGSGSAGIGQHDEVGASGTWCCEYRWWSTPRRCRSCPAVRIRSAGRRPPGRCPPSARCPPLGLRRCGTGSGPARCWPSAPRPPAARRPRRRWCWNRPEPRTPTRLLRAAGGRPTPRRRRRPGRRSARRGGPRGPQAPARTAGLDPPARTERSAPVRPGRPVPPLPPVLQVHRSGGGAETSAPGSRSAGATPGYSAGSRGRSATVT